MSDDDGDSDYVGTIALTGDDMVELIDCVRECAEALEWYDGDTSYEVRRARALLRRLVS